MTTQETQTSPIEPKTLVGIKRAEVVMIAYVDPTGISHTQLAIVGEKSVTLLKGTIIGLTDARNEPSGMAPAWLRDQVFKALDELK